MIRTTAMYCCISIRVLVDEDGLSMDVATIFDSWAAMDGIGMGIHTRTKIKIFYITEKIKL